MLTYCSRLAASPGGPKEKARDGKGQEIRLAINAIWQRGRLANVRAAALATTDARYLAPMDGWQRLVLTLSKRSLFLMC